MKIPFIFSSKDSELKPLTTLNQEYGYVIKALSLNKEHWDGEALFVSIGIQRMLNECLFNDYIIKEVNKLKLEAPVAFKQEFDKIVFKRNNKDILFQNIYSTFSEKQALMLGDIYKKFRLSVDFVAQKATMSNYQLFSEENLRKDLPQSDDLHIYSHIHTKLLSQMSTYSQDTKIDGLLRLITKKMTDVEEKKNNLVNFLDNITTVKTLKEINETQESDFYLKCFKEKFPALGIQIDKILIKNVIKPTQSVVNKPKSVHKL